MREALDHAIEELLGCRELLGGAHVLRAVGNLLDFRWVSACADCSSSGIIVTDEGVVLARLFGWDQSFIDLWGEKHLTLTDPVGQACRFATRPFAWHSGGAWEKWPSLTPGQRRMMELLRRHGIHCGIAVPVHRPRGRVAWIALVHDRERGDLAGLLLRHSGQFMLLGSYFMDLVYRDQGESMDDAELTMLSGREVECLTLVARGKTDLEIGEIMGRSPTTARFHVEKAIRKLGATTRTQAAAMASQLGIIGPVV
ncbi:MAG: autoinducer binding domain-containing protein [Sphingomonadales bacterium]